jgi:hypothetical protein
MEMNKKEKYSAIGYGIFLAIILLTLFYVIIS